MSHSYLQVSGTIDFDLKSSHFTAFLFLSHHFYHFVKQPMNALTNHKLKAIFEDQSRR